MAKNIEIKARARDFDTMLQRATRLSGKSPKVILQEDVFFHVSKGRLKLRRLSQNVGELIFYDRPDCSGPKTSTYSITHTDNPEQLRSVLADALGETAYVKKIRKLLLVGQTRVHLDVVEGLGEFVELEVVLSEMETERFGESIAIELMEQLGIDSADLVQGSYADLLSGGVEPD